MITFQKEWTLLDREDGSKPKGAVGLYPTVPTANATGAVENATASAPLSMFICELQFII